MINKSWT